MKKISLIIIFLFFASHAWASTYYVDYENGNDASAGTSWALAKKTITGVTAAMLSPGDTVKIAKSPDPTPIGDAVWTNLSKTITLDAPLTSNIDLCESAWTAASWVTITAETGLSPKQGNYCEKMVIASDFASGLVGYYDIPDTDYSSCEQVSFWIKNTVALSANTLSLWICSDDVGTASESVVDIPAISSTSSWLPITVDLGTPITASAESIALYANSDPGTQTIYLDDIIACYPSASDESLTLTSLIGKNTAGETWYGLQSINGTTVLLDNGTNTNVGNGQGYYGGNEDVATYKRDTTQCTQNQEIQDNGTEASPITVSGGWNTSSGSQDGETWYDGASGSINGITSTGKDYIEFSNISFVRYNSAMVFNISANHWIINNLSLNNNNSYGFDNLNSWDITMDNVFLNNNNAGLRFWNRVYQCNIDNLTANNNLDNGIYLSTTFNCNWSNLDLHNNTNAGFATSTSFRNYINIADLSDNDSGIYLRTSADNFFYNINSHNNNSTDVDAYWDTGVYFFDSLLSSTIPVSFSGSDGLYYIQSHNYNGTAGTYKTYQSFSDGTSGICGIISDQITASYDNAWAYGGEGTCMVFDPKSTTDPLVWEFYVPVTAATDFAVEFQDRITASADCVMTVTIYDSDDNATKLLDAENVPFADDNDWHLYTSTSCTPTDTGFCRVVLEALDGATSGDIGIDNIGLNPDVDDNYGNMDRWMEGLPPKFITDSNVNASSAFAN